VTTRRDALQKHLAPLQNEGLLAAIERDLAEALVAGGGAV
jgi:hypothetical protein